MNDYSQKQIDIMLNMHFRWHHRPTPWKVIMRAMEIDVTETAFDRLLWGVCTGYGSPDPKDKDRVYRREYMAGPMRDNRYGWPWYKREDEALTAALDGVGQKRCPPCDIPYIARVLNRSEEEVAERWKHLHSDSLGREGFFANE